MTEWFWNREEFAAAVAIHGSVAETARAMGVNRATLQHWSTKHGVFGTSKFDRHVGTRQSTPEPTGEDWATVTLPAHPKRAESRTPEQVLRDHGLDPDLWDVSTYADNYWQGNDGDGPTQLTQSKVTAKRRTPAGMVLPPRTDAPLRKAPRAARATTTKPLLIALPSDVHAPHQDTDLEACWLSWLETNRPGRIVNLGDIVNLAKPSRHRANLHAKHNDTPEDCFHAANAWWRRTIEAAGPLVQCDQLPGNHDLRASIACMERLPDLYDTRRPGEQHPWHDLEYMLGLDKLGVTYHRPAGEYHASEIQLAKGLSVTHGAAAGPMGGAVKDAPRFEGSRIVGHDHKSAVTHTVRYRDGEPRVHVNVSAGTMSRRDLGYQANPDAQQGFATVTLHANGQWNVELARFDSRRKTLHWRDQMYSA